MVLVHDAFLSYVYRLSDGSHTLRQRGAAHCPATHSYFEANLGTISRRVNSSQARWSKAKKVVVVVVVWVECCATITRLKIGLLLSLPPAVRREVNAARHNL